MKAVNGDKEHNEKTVRSSSNLYSSPEQVATGLESRWCGGRTGSGSPCGGRGATLVKHPLDSGQPIDRRSSAGGRLRSKDKSECLMSSRG